MLNCESSFWLGGGDKTMMYSTKLNRQIFIELWEQNRNHGYIKKNKERIIERDPKTGNDR